MVRVHLMYAPDFSGCWAKIERAKEHRDSLDQYVRDWGAVENNCPRLGIKFKAETGEHIVYVQSMPDYTRFLQRSSLIVGDAIHNLRGALDHLAFQLALKNTAATIVNERERMRRIQFPIEDAPERFKRRCQGRNRGGWIADLHADHQAIIERYQVYHRLDDEGLEWARYFHPLETLRDLSDADKHRLLLRVVCFPSSIRIRDPAVSLIAQSHIRADLERFGAIAVNFVEPNAELYHARMPWPQTQMNMAGHVIPEISLADGRPIIKVIDRIAAVVVKIVREFDPLP